MTVTDNAKSLIGIIAFEVRLVDQRVAGKHIRQAQALGCILERLSAKARDNVNLKTFLTTIAFIPEEEDEGEDYPWAEDKRDSRQHDVRATLPEGDLGESREFPVPGERVC